VIVIGSIFTRSKNLLEDSMHKAIVEEALEQSASHCRILPATLKENIGDIAALCVAIIGE